MRILFLTGVAVFMSFTLAVAQPDFDLAAKQTGDVTRWQADNGKTSVRFLGRRGAFFVFDFRRDASRGEPLALRFWANGRGEAVKARYKGKMITYTPSDCSLTIGRCTYVETDPSGSTKQMTWQAEVNGDLWHYTLYQGKTLREEGTFTVDKYGYYVDRDYISYNNGKGRRQWSRRLRALN